MDAIGNPIEVGDKVAITEPYKRHLVRATVVKVTKCGATCLYKYRGKDEKTSRRSYQIVKI